MNWRAWMEWAGDHQSGLLYVFFLVVGGSHMFYMPAAAYRLYRISAGMRFKELRLVSYLLAALAIDGWCSLLANIDRPTGVTYSLWFAVLHWTGKTILWALSSMLCLYIFWPWEGQGGKAPILSRLWRKIRGRTG